MLVGYSRRRFSRRYKKRQKIFRPSLFIKLFLIVGLIFSLYRLFVALPTVSAEITAASSLTQPKAVLVWPSYGSGAIGAIGYDGVLDYYGDQSARPIASITKVITALVVLNAYPINDDGQGQTITLSEADKEIFNRGIAEDAAVVPVFVGESLTERQILELIMLPSAANYSETLAIWAYGSVEAYLQAANLWLRNNGMNDTTVTDTSGLSAGNVSSPSDLIKLAKLALANPVIASISSMAQAEIPNIGVIKNTNGLLGDSGVNGIKTGSTDEAGICLLFSSVISVGDKQITIVGVVLNGTSRAQENADVIRLIGSIKEGFRSVTITTPGQEYATYSTKWGQTTELVSDQSISEIVWSDSPISVEVKADDITTVKKGVKKGQANISVNDKEIVVPLITTQTITYPRLVWRLTNFELF